MAKGAPSSLAASKSSRQTASNTTSASGLANMPLAITTSLPAKPVGHIGLCRPQDMSCFHTMGPMGRRAQRYVVCHVAVLVDTASGWAMPTSTTTWQITQCCARPPIGPMVGKHDVIRKTRST